MTEELMICSIKNCSCKEDCIHGKTHSINYLCKDCDLAGCPACIEYVEVINPNHIESEVIKAMNKVYEDTTY